MLENDKRLPEKRNNSPKYYVVFNMKLVWQDIYLSFNVFFGSSQANERKREKNNTQSKKIY